MRQACGKVVQSRMALGRDLQLLHLLALVNHREDSGKNPGLHEAHRLAAPNRLTRRRNGPEFGGDFAGILYGTTVERKHSVAIFFMNPLREEVRRFEPVRGRITQHVLDPATDSWKLETVGVSA